METVSDERNNEVVRAIIGTICFLLGMVCTYGCLIYCIIKCDDKKSKTIIHMKTVRVSGPATIQVEQSKFNGLV